MCGQLQHDENEVCHVTAAAVAAAASVVHQLRPRAALDSRVLCCAAGVVDACLIPEVPFKTKGERGLFAYIEKVLHSKGHAVVCIAEGAGQVSRCRHCHPLQHLLLLIVVLKLALLDGSFDTRLSSTRCGACCGLQPYSLWRSLWYLFGWGRSCRAARSAHPLHTDC